jgi:isocitrate dehydrogenase (NAD+)
MSKVALIVGGGISREIVAPVLSILEAANVDIEWQRVDVPDFGDGDIEELLEEAAAAVEACGIGLKTRLFAPPARPEYEGDAPGTNNPNVLLRKRLGLYAGVLPIRPMEGIRTRYPGLDLLLVRENTEDIYKGIEHEIVPGVVESLKVVTREACERIARFAFAAIRTLGRSHLTFMHKANIMKLSDGLFLETVRRVAADHADIGYQERIVDAACMQLVLDPYQFDVILTGNHYGDILSNIGSGLAGGVSGAHSLNIGDSCRVYEAVHGGAPHLVGTGLANPLPLLSPALALLEHLGESEAEARIRRGVAAVLADGSHTTPDLGGETTGSDMAEAIVAAFDA